MRIAGCGVRQSSLSSCAPAIRWRFCPAVLAVGETQLNTWQQMNLAACWLAPSTQQGIAAVSPASSMCNRDVFNEKPATDELVAAEGGETGSSAVLPRGAVVHTTRGDIWIKLFPDECPKTVENFTTHARNGYYDGVIVHRVIKGFMIQTGDPLGAR